MQGWLVAICVYAFAQKIHFAQLNLFLFNMHGRKVMMDWNPL